MGEEKIGMAQGHGQGEKGSCLRVERSAAFKRMLIKRRGGTLGDEGRTSSHALTTSGRARTVSKPPHPLQLLSPHPLRPCHCVGTHSPFRTRSSAAETLGLVLFCASCSFLSDQICYYH